MRSLVQSFAVLVVAVGAVVGASLVWPLGNRGCGRRVAVGVLVGMAVGVLLVWPSVQLLCACSCGCGRGHACGHRRSCACGFAVLLQLHLQVIFAVALAVINDKEGLWCLHLIWSCMVLASHYLVLALTMHPTLQSTI